jgi:hypothetical protein
MTCIGSGWGSFGMGPHDFWSDSSYTEGSWYVFENGYYEGVRLISSGISNLMIRNNAFFHHKDRKISLKGPQRRREFCNPSNCHDCAFVDDYILEPRKVYIYNNTFYNTHTQVQKGHISAGEISACAGAADYQFTNEVFIKNNLMANPNFQARDGESALVYFETDDGAAEYIAEFSNNILGGTDLDDPRGVLVVEDFFGTGNSWWVTPSEWDTLFPQVSNNGWFEVPYEELWSDPDNPQLLNGDAKTFGQSLPGVWEDYNGNPRPTESGAIISAGALE